jgi:hypothetical protein
MWRADLAQSLTPRRVPAGKTQPSITLILVLVRMEP